METNETDKYSEQTTLKQTALADWLDHAPGGHCLWLARNWFCLVRCRRPIRIRGGRDPAVGKFQIKPRAGTDAGRGMQRMTRLIAHQRKAAREHAAIGQRRQQLLAAFDPRLKPLQRSRERASRALGQSMRALAVAGDGLTLRLRIGQP